MVSVCWVLSALPTQPLEKFPWHCLWSSKGSVKEPVSTDVARFHWVNIVKILQVCFFSPCLVVTVDLVVDADTRLVSVVGFDSQQSAVVLPCSAGNQAAGIREDSTVCSLVLPSAEPNWLAVGIKSIQINDLLFVLTCFKRIKADFLLQDSNLSKALLYISSYFRLGSSPFHYHILCLVLF